MSTGRAAQPARTRRPRLHNDERTIAMQVEEIIQSDLNANEKATLAADKERWVRMGMGAHLGEWLAYGEGMMLRRRLAMRIAHTNQPLGRGYTEAFGALMRRDGFAWNDNSVKTA